MSNLGGPDFIEWCRRLYNERHFESQSDITSIVAQPDGEAYLKQTLMLVQNHKWYSDAAKRHLGDQQHRNASKLEELLGTASEQHSTR